MNAVSWGSVATALVAGILLVGLAGEAKAQRGAAGAAVGSAHRTGTGGGGYGYSRAGTASGGGFSQGTPSQNKGARPSAASGSSTTVSGSCGNCWDSGDAAAGFVAGAAVAGAASRPAAAAAAAPTTVTLPCDVAPVTVNGVPYYKCGATWYTAALASAGIVYVPAAPPPGN
jgi:hypothetical protein